MDTNPRALAKFQEFENATMEFEEILIHLTEAQLLLTQEIRMNGYTPKARYYEKFIYEGIAKLRKQKKIEAKYFADWLQDAQF